MSATPHIDALLANSNWHALVGMSKSAALAAEVRALLAERDELRTKLATLTAPPARTLRAYKGVTYRDGKFWWCGTHGTNASALIASFPSTFTDADHAALLDLKANPWEDVPDRVVEIIQDAVDRAFDYGSRSFASEWEGTIELAQKTAADIRAIVRAEGGGK